MAVFVILVPCSHPSSSIFASLFGNPVGSDGRLLPLLSIVSLTAGLLLPLCLALSPTGKSQTGAATGPHPPVLSECLHLHPFPSTWRWLQLAALAACFLLLWCGLRLTTDWLKPLWYNRKCCCSYVYLHIDLSWGKSFLVVIKPFCWKLRPI